MVNYQKLFQEKLGNYLYRLGIGENLVSNINLDIMKEKLVLFSHIRS
jgi:hypothetical protein